MDQLSKWYALVPIVAAIAIRLFLTDAVGAVALVVVAVEILAVCWVVGRGVLVGVLREPVPDRAMTSASIVVGACVLIIASNVLLLCRAPSLVQTMVMSAVVVGAVAVVVRRSSDAGRGWGVEVVPILVAIAASAFPMIVHDAFSVAGNQLDSLRHQDGAQHTLLVFASQLGVPRAEAYSLGIHSFLGTFANVLGLDPFRTVAAGVPAIAALVACGAHWLACSVGLGRRVAIVIGVLVGAHPLLVFVAMEHYLPQLAACALVAAACAIASTPNRGRRSQVLLALVLAALLAAYGLAFVIVIPLVAVVAVRQGQFRVVAVLQVLALVIVLAPMGTLRIAERGQIIGEHPERTFEVSTQPADRSVLFPSSDVISWNVSLAHVFGFTPFRDHFKFTSRQLEDEAPAISTALDGWAAAIVPALVLCTLLVVAFSWWRARPTTLAIGTGVVLGLAYALFVAEIVRGYHLFKITSLVTVPVVVIVISALDVLVVPRWRSLVLGVFIACQVPALVAIEARYAFELALDRDFVAVVEPLRAATRRRNVVLTDTWDTSRVYWLRNYVLGLARIGTIGDLVLCSCRECPQLPVLVEDGSYCLLQR
ncbi:MAG: hypothetical protein H0V17_31835 [Deltaproteobacteria bacterium]|nr:hypothetical protein [Deltaproteobacteria bacterium]